MMRIETIIRKGKRSEGSQIATIPLIRHKRE